MSDGSVNTAGKLQFANELGNKIVVWDGGPNDRYGIGLNGGNLNVFIHPGAKFSIRHNGYDGAEQFVVMGDGRVGIGATTPTAGKLQFANEPGNKMVIWDSGPNDRYGIGLNSYNLNAFIPTFAKFSIRNNGYDGAEPFTISGDGIATGKDFRKSSDARYKDDIENLSGALDKILRLRGVSFRWLDELSKPERQLGLIGQEVREVLPEAVFQDELGFLSIAYSSITSVLIEAVKEQQARINKMEESISELKELVRNSTGLNMGQKS
jgi:hypothetical protein